MLESDLEFLRHHHAGELGHTGASLLDHLRGTAALLADWGAHPDVVRAGLFHSVYGTGAFAEAAVAPGERARLAAQIGPRAEALVHRFCTLDRTSLYANAGRTGAFTARERRTGAEVTLEAGELADLLHLTSANWVEQRPRLVPAVRRARCADLGRVLDHLAPAARDAVAAAVTATLAEPAAPSLVELFAFDDPAEVDRQCGELDVRYLGVASRRLQDRIAPALLDRLNQLGDDAYLAILRSPETCYRLFADDHDLARYLDDALCVEEWRAGARHEFDRPAWSATGDLHVPAGPPGAPAEVHAGDRLYRAPHLHGFLVDLASPAAHRALAQLTYKRVPYGPNEPFTSDERAAVLGKLAGALDGIARTNPIITRFLRYTLHAIIPRKQTQPHLYPSSFKGSSAAVALHRANLYNVQQPNVDTARLAQSIVHESVHIHLYKRELFEPTLIDDAAGEALRVTSPWSGNSLDLYVFVHSTTVYYALYQLFSHPAAARHLPPDTVAWYVDRAIHGFSSDAWADIVATHGALIAPDVRRDLWAMRERVTGGVS
jgi:HD domain